MHTGKSRLLAFWEAHWVVPTLPIGLDPCIAQGTCSRKSWLCVAGTTQSANICRHCKGRHWLQNSWRQKPAALQRGSGKNVSQRDSIFSEPGNDIYRQMPMPAAAKS